MVCLSDRVYRGSYRACIILYIIMHGRVATARGTYLLLLAAAYVCAWNLEELSSITNPRKPSQCLLYLRVSRSCIHIPYLIFPAGDAGQCSRVWLSCKITWHGSCMFNEATLVLIRAAISGNKNKVLLFLVLLTCSPCSITDSIAPLRHR